MYRVACSTAAWVYEVYEVFVICVLSPCTEPLRAGGGAVRRGSAARGPGARARRATTASSRRAGNRHQHPRHGLARRVGCALIRS